MTTGIHKITEEDIQSVVRKIVEGVKPEKVILFGSYASGQPNKDSDLDLLVIVESDLPFVERYQMVSRLFRPRRFPMDLLVFTPAEVEKRMQSVNSVIRHAVERGRVLYESNHN